eukprot:Hpha_TRINITY_DN16147_c4_g8::TRINITY_DN16147_c4_g8_i1::g.6204::m.6204/K05349/bglX; beta-glucosidase
MAGSLLLLLGASGGSAAVYDGAAACAASFLAKHPKLPGEWIRNDLFGGLNDDNYVGKVNGTKDVPDINMMDGPHGVRDLLSGRYLANRTAWPATGVHGLALMPELSYYIGRAGARDFLAVGSNVQLGPGVCVHRVPVGGRNWEYISGEEAEIGYALSGEVTRGIQSINVMATGKHWAMNNQELNRNKNMAIISEGVMMENYLRAFQSQIDAGSGAFMCSYNRVQVMERNNTQAWMCGDRHVSGHLLRNVMGFKGALMTDWTNQVNSTTGGVTTINRDVVEWEMNWAEDLRLKVPKNDSLRATLTKNALTGMYAAGVMECCGTGCKADNTPPSIDHLPPLYQSAMRNEDPQMLAAVLVAEGTVLLKKSDSIPFSGPKVILIAGEAMLSGGGSGDNGAFGYQQKKHVGQDLHTGGVVGQEALKAALTLEGHVAYWDYELPTGTKVDVVLSLGAQYRGEAYEADQKDGYLDIDQCDSANARANKSLTYGTCDYPATVKALRAKYPDALLVSYVTAGGSFIAHDYIDSVDAAYTTFYPGQHFGTGLALMFTGAVSPGGKLSFTIPGVEKGPGGKTYLQSPIARFNSGLEYPTHHKRSPAVTIETPGYAWDEAADKVSGVVQYGVESSEYSEGRLIGYKYYEKYGMKPLFGFGFGLSHVETSVSPVTPASGCVEEGKNCVVGVKVVVNPPQGMVASEVIQVYVGYSSSSPANDVGRPVRSLRAFRKVWSSGTYDITLTSADFATTWSTKLEKFVTPCEFDGIKGTYHITVNNQPSATLPCTP